MGYQPPGRSFRVGLEIADTELRRSIATAIDRRDGLSRAEPAEADVVMRERFGALETDAPALAIVEASASPGTDVSLVTGEDIEVAVSAAHLVAAGYLVSRSPERNGFDGPAPQRRDVGLTPRETEVLDLLVAGASNKLIARRLGISVHTAKFHVTAVIDKLAARNRSEAVGIALRAGLVAL